MSDCLISELKLRAEADDSHGRVTFELRGSRAVVTVRQDSLEPITGRRTGEAVVRFEGMRQFGRRVAFSLPLRFQVQGNDSAADDIACALVTEWLLELSET